MLDSRITLGSSRRRPFSRRKALVALGALVLLFLALWQVPLRRKEVSRNVDLPAPTEVR
ncbi:MAG: hypothetical protein LBI17_04140 [Rickettsiales bacterium]|jgi:ABC-type nitrate/sulfonate/bicarbonate transport system permease component|nr:hypothetical protein [Rickettsiales bacterium]